MKLPDYPDGVLPERRVSRDDWPAFFQALRDENTVEGIAVMELQFLNLEYVFEFNGKYTNAIGTQFRSQIITCGNW